MLTFSKTEYFPNHFYVSQEYEILETGFNNYRNPCRMLHTIRIGAMGYGISYLAQVGL